MNLKEKNFQKILVLYTGGWGFEVRVYWETQVILILYLQVDLFNLFIKHLFYMWNSTLEHKMENNSPCLESCDFVVVIVQMSRQKEIWAQKSVFQRW